MDRAPLTAAVLAALRAMGEWQVGDGVAPRAPDGSPTPPTPYLILYSIDGGGFTGPEWHDPHADATFVYQVTAVGERRDQVETLMDRARARLVGRGTDGSYLVALEPSGCVVGDRSIDSVGGVDREGLVFSSVERFAFTVTPT